MSIFCPGKAADFTSVVDIYPNALQTTFGNMEANTMNPDQNFPQGF